MSIGYASLSPGPGHGAVVNGRSSGSSGSLFLPLGPGSLVGGVQPSGSTGPSLSPGPGHGSVVIAVIVDVGVTSLVMIRLLSLNSLDRIQQNEWLVNG